MLFDETKHEKIEAGYNLMLYNNLIDENYDEMHHFNIRDRFKIAAAD